MSSKRMKEERKMFFRQRIHAILKGYTLKFNKVASGNPKMGYANIVHSANEVVEGVLYDISDSDLAKLDFFEGYPENYYRTEVTVQLDDGREVETLTYIAQPNKISVGLKPSRKYLGYLLAGKDLLTESYYKKLLVCETLD